MDNPQMEEVIKKQKEQCIFCKIIAGEIPTIKVYEDDLVLAIMDINPAADGHVLMMPKEHYPIMPWIPRDTFKHMFKISKYIARAIEDAFAVKSQIFIANGAVAGQQSAHFMMHIMPEVKTVNTNGDNSSIDESLLGQLQQFMPNAINQSIEMIAKEDPSVVRKIGQNTKSNEENPQEAQEQGANITNEQRELITQLFNSDEEFRRLVLEDVPELRKRISENENLQQVFNGIDIDALSRKLKEMGGANNG